MKDRNRRQLQSLLIRPPWASSFQTIKSFSVQRAIRILTRRTEIESPEASTQEEITGWGKGEAAGEDRESFGEGLGKRSLNFLPVQFAAQRPRLLPRKLVMWVPLKDLL